MRRRVALFFLLGCRGSPRDSIHWEERWEVLALTEHGNIVDARLVVSNRELIRGQGRVHLEHWSNQSMPVLHTQEVEPGDVEIAPQGGDIRIGMDRLQEGERWTLQLGSNDANLLLEMTPRANTPEPVTWQPNGGQWSMEAPVAGSQAMGWLEAGGRGGHFQAQAVVLHRGGDGSPSLPREGVFVMGKDIAIGLDQQDSNRLVWAQIDGQPIPVDDLSLERTADGATLDFRPTVDLLVEIKAQDPSGTTDPLAHYSWLERQAARVWTDVAWRRVEAGTATLTLNGESMHAGAIFVSEGPEYAPVGSEATPQ